MSLSISLLLQYALLAIPAYILIISPLLTIFSPSPAAPLFSREALENITTLVLPSPSLATTCPPHTYTTRILSRSPLVILISDFLAPAERAAILAAADPLYAPSPVYGDDADDTLDRAVRNSHRAMLPRSHAVQCIEARALVFQGFPRDTFIERLWAQRYTPGGHYAHHFDYTGDVRSRGAGRVSTFMVYVDCEGCVGGGTEFPRLKRPAGREWCDVIDCEAEGDGVVFKPTPGAAVYWENFDGAGNGWQELWHAGLQVQEGTKVGLNVWSWYQPGYQEVYDRKMREEQEGKEPAAETKEEKSEL